MVKSRYYCDRCGAEYGRLMEVGFKSYGYCNESRLKLKQVCKECYEEFWQLADCFFDDVNMEGAEMDGGIK